jgi:hypothetical protein
MVTSGGSPPPEVNGPRSGNIAAVLANEVLACLTNFMAMPLRRTEQVGVLGHHLTTESARGARAEGEIGCAGTPRGKQFSRRRDKRPRSEGSLVAKAVKRPAQGGIRRGMATSADGAKSGFDDAPPRPPLSMLHYGPCDLPDAWLVASPTTHELDSGKGRMPAETKTTTRIDRSKTYLCRFSCGYETNWPAARGRHESARHDGHAPAHRTVRSISGTNGVKPAGNARTLPASTKRDRLLDQLREQYEAVLQALKKASLLVLAERDLRTREAEQIKADLRAIHEVLERNRQAREHRLNALIR